MVKPAPRSRKMPLLTRILAVLAISAAFGQAQEVLPLPQSLSPVLPPVSGLRDEPLPQGAAVFLKPTKTIKPPASIPVAASGAQAEAPPLQIVSSPSPDTRLRRLVVVDATMNPDVIRRTILASGQSRVPVTMAGGVSAPAPVLSDLAGLFGSTADEAMQKKVIETVKKGMGSSSRRLKRVEVVGWVPSQGVMAVAVYPES